MFVALTVDENNRITQYFREEADGSMTPIDPPGSLWPIGSKVPDPVMVANRPTRIPLPPNPFDQDSPVMSGRLDDDDQEVLDRYCSDCEESPCSCPQDIDGEGVSNATRRQG